MESCTLLVLGSQYGVQIYDWNGAILIHDYDFIQQGVAKDEKQVNSIQSILFIMIKLLFRYQGLW